MKNGPERSHATTRREELLREGSHAVRRLSWTSLRLLGILGKLRPDERREARAAFLTLFGFMTGHALLETARDALFLARLPARQLPWVYLAIAVLALALGQREPRIVRRLSGGNELARWLLAAGGVTVAIWSVAGQPWPWVYYALYVWSGVLATLVVIRFWTVLGSRFTLTQAKRIFPLVASGSVAGAIAGSGIARGLTAALSAQHLVLAAGVVFLVTARAPKALGEATPRAPAADPDDLRRIARVIWSEPYLRRVAGVVLLATVTFTLIDFVFKSTADRWVAPGQLGAFFSTVYLTLNVLSLLVQLLGAAWLLRHAGLIATVAVVPALLLLATLGFTVGGGLTLALLLKGTDGSLRYSVHRTGMELLFLPLSERLRTRVKGFIDVLGQRGGQALASILILMVLSATGQERIFAAFACLTAVGWLVGALSLKDHYLNVFRQTLHEDARTDVGTREFPALDVASLETLLATLNSPDEERVVAALDILQDQGKATVVPALLLYHPARSVVVRALEIFQQGGREDAIPVAKGLLEHADHGIRAAALRMLSALRPEREVLERMATDADPRVAATAQVSLLACGWGDGGARLRDLLSVIEEGDPSVQRSIASAARTHPSGAVEPVILRLLRVEDLEALRESVAAASLLRSPDLLAPLMGLLPRRAVREETRSALAAFGPIGLARMMETLRDSTPSISVRRHLPGAIALVGSPQAADLLLRHLRDEPDGLIRFKILRALGRWRNEQPDLPLDPRLLGDALEQALATGYRLMEWRRGLERIARRGRGRRTELHQVLVALLRDKQDHSLERTFRLLNLRSGSEEFQRVYLGLHSPRAASRIGSREILHHLVPPPMRHHLLVLVDDLYVEGGRPTPPDRPRERGAEIEIFTALLGSGMESVSSLAAAHAAELGLRGLAGALGRCHPLSEEHARTLAEARATLTAEAS